MDVIVALADDFSVSADEFAHRWNVDRQHVDVAVARPGKTALDHFGSGEVLGTVLVVLGSLASGVSANALYDLIKSAIRPADPTTDMHYVQIEKPDGTVVIDVRITRHD